jgi:hypothetical protein
MNALLDRLAEAVITGKECRTSDEGARRSPALSIGGLAYLSRIGMGAADRDDALHRLPPQLGCHARLISFTNSGIPSVRSETARISRAALYHDDSRDARYFTVISLSFHTH